MSIVTLREIEIFLQERRVPTGRNQKTRFYDIG